MMVIRDNIKPPSKYVPISTVFVIRGTVTIIIIRLDPYSLDSVKKLLKKFESNVNIIKGNSNKVLKEINLNKIDYVFLDGGHKFETVRNDLEYLTKVINNNGTILCDDYDLTYAPGVKKAIDEYIVQKNFNLRILESRFAEITKSN